MEYTPLTPFRRAIDAAQLQTTRMHASPLPRSVNKWTALRDLSAARAEYDLSDRDMTVLQALLSFLPGDELRDGHKTVVHASNATICARLHDMPCSTMRRHLGKLISSGMIQRRDSPNGKRYVRRGLAGQQSFGLDLTPLLHRRDEIAAAADRARAADAERAFLRETVSLMRRDLAQLLTLVREAIAETRLNFVHMLLDETARSLRRKLGAEELHQIKSTLLTAIEMLREALPSPETQPEAVIVSSNDVQNEQHHLRSKKEYLESEEAAGIPDKSIPLELVLSSCPEILCYSETPVRSWRDFLILAEKVSLMLGIEGSYWHEARTAMGVAQASAAVAAILQRFSSIRSPVAYLRSLTRKAQSCAFSVLPMLMALPANRSSQL